MNGPMCCGMPAFENVISPRLKFWVCGECKKEVHDLPPVEPEGKEDRPEDWMWLYGVPNPHQTILAPDDFFGE